MNIERYKIISAAHEYIGMHVTGALIGGADPITGLTTQEDAARSDALRDAAYAVTNELNRLTRRR